MTASLADLGPQERERVLSHFALIEACVLSIDWLELHAQGHRRARFDKRDPPRWLQP